MIKDTNELNRK